MTVEKDTQQVVDLGGEIMYTIWVTRNECFNSFQFSYICTHILSVKTLICFTEGIIGVQIA